LTDEIGRQISLVGTWIKWGTGYFYTNHTVMVMDHLSEGIFEENEYKEIINIHTIDTNIQSSNMYSNRCITDSYGDRYFDYPIYLLHQASEEVNDYFQVETRKLSFKKRIRLVRFKSNIDRFDIEQILFQNKPTDCNIIPTLEKAVECDEYSQLDNLENCFLLLWKCMICDVKSDHWTKLSKHNCKENESLSPKSKKTSENKNPFAKNNRAVPTIRTEHVCPHCNGEFDSEGYLRTHLMVHVNDSNKCPYCEQPIAPEMMKTHLIAHQNPKFSNLKFLCKYDLILY